MNQLNLEQKLLILTSRLTFSEDDSAQIIEIAQEKNLNWFEFFKLALYHKTAVLCWINIKKIVDKKNIFSKYLNDAIYGIYVSQRKRNEMYQNEIGDVISKLQHMGVVCIPVKGVHLIPNMYKDLGVRYSGDADLLFKHSDIDKIENVMKSLNYIKGSYNAKENKVTPIDRVSEIKWKMFKGNLSDYIKVTDSEYCPFFKLDLRFALDDALDKKPVEEIINSFIDSKKINPSHILIHLCTHFYREAKNTVTIFYAKDMNLIKLCDIREYIIQYMDNNVLRECIDFAHKYNFEKHLYYTMFFLKLIYKDGYEQDIMDSLQINDFGFLNTYGENTKDEQYVFEKDFYQRLFSCGNQDLLENKPKFLQM